MDTRVGRGDGRGAGRRAGDGAAPRRRCYATDSAEGGAVLARTQADLDRTVEQLLEVEQADAVGLQADITDREQVDTAFALVGERSGTLNILVDTTGPGGLGGFEEA